MPFDQPTRNLLQRTVSRCRDILAGRWDSPADGEFFKQLQEIYGISPDGTAAPLEVLEHLSDEDLETARVLREILDHYTSGLVATGKKPAEARREAVLRLAREQAFTVLNRLAALRMAEERGIVLECVRQGLQSEGFQLFQQSAGTALGSTPAAYRTYLFVLFDELSRDLGVLFNRFDKSSLLFPRHMALEAILRELNGTGAANKDAAFTPAQISALWAEDEAIGWIYQYYNDQAERKAMRDESAAPRNSRELAVRNQFFTPRYVVEFLTDNTLGRIWYEMTKGRTKLKEQCKYLVRRPTEVFLGPEESAPEVSSVQSSVFSKEATENSKLKTENLSQEELLRQTVFIPHRPLKDPRSILMLDPACGSMHFGLYAFDLFEVIYEEFWDLHAADPENFKLNPENSRADSLFSLYATKGDFLRDVPRLIIENNLHGIDIDPRCAQIAGLSLWLRAQKAWQRLGLSPAQRPAIKRSNIVCAEPMPGEKELLREFVEREFPAAERAVCLRLLEAIFDKMQLAGEAGSLLKIEEEIRSAIEDAKKQWKAGPQMEQSQLFSDEKLKQQDIPLDYSGLTESEFWDQLEEKIYAALRDYAEQAENGGGFQRRLFAEDAARGFAFIDVCRKRYDVALMNPPFGEGALNSKKYVDIQYGDARYDVLTCFIERGLNALNSGGALGLIGNRTPFFLPMLADWRTRSIIEQSGVTTFVDLGHGVLDSAMVEVCATTLTRPRTSSLTPFYKVVSAKDKRAALEGILATSPEGKEIDGSLFLKAVTDFLSIPKSPFSYWIPENLLRLFKKATSFDEHFEAWVGLQTNDDWRWLRLRWETPQPLLNDRWYPFAKGGEYSEFVSNIHLVVDWEHDGRRIKGWKNSELELGRITANNSQCWNETKYLRKGITWTQRTTRRFSARILPEKCIFGIKGPSAFSLKNSDEGLLALLGLFETDIYKTLLEFQVAAADAAAKSYDAGLVRRTPFPQLPERTVVELANLARSCVHDTIHALACDETSAYFLTNGAPPSTNIKEHKEQLSTLVQALYGLEGFDPITIADIADPAEADDVEFVPTCVDARISHALGVAFGRWNIRYATGEQAAPELPDPFAPLPVCPPGQLQNAQGLPMEKEEVGRMKEEGIWNYPIEIPWDGILVDDPNHPLDIECRVREVIEIIWSGQEGGPTAEAIEHEACEILGVKSLRDYFRKPAGFFADHLKRYSKSRRQAPIYWPLSTASGSYTLWIYYHRLTPDTLYKCLQQFVEPKIREIEQDLVRLRAMDEAGEGGRQTRDQLAKAETLRTELLALRDELAHWAPRWKPNLNDGVQITASPLWKLFLLPKWRKTLEQTWKELDRGDYDWAHLAHTLHPARVREKCKTDRSLAIAHSLEDLCQIQAPAPKKKRGKKAQAEEELL